MTPKTTICLWFDGSALDAATFPDSALGVTSLGCAASNRRRGIGSESTHWRIGTWGMTWFTGWPPSVPYAGHRTTGKTRAARN